MVIRGRLIVVLFGVAALIVGLLFAKTFTRLKGSRYEQITGKRMRILAYSSFMGSTGPGLQLVEEFKKQCQCDIEVSNAGDAGLLLERLKLSKKDQYDLVIGFDQLTLPDAQKKMEWLEVEIKNVKWADEIKGHVTSKVFPYDWSPMAFVYRKEEIEAPKSLDDLLSDNYHAKIAIQDPRSSTPGLEFYEWVRFSKKEKTAEYLEKLKPNIQSVSPSWSFSYGLFKKGLAKLVYSYVTSLVYHWEVEKDPRYQVASFTDGHPYQVEFAAIPKACTECQLAKDFLAMMLSPEGQSQISRKNFMFPAVKGVETFQAFADLPKLKLIQTPLDKDLEVWSRVFRK